MNERVARARLIFHRACGWDERAKARTRLQQRNMNRTEQITRFYNGHGVHSSVRNLFDVYANQHK